MNDFTIGKAWGLGLDFIRRAPAGHAILLILIGAVIPTVIQFLLVGGSASLTNPAMFGQGAPMALAYGGVAMLAAMAIGYIFQTGGYFGSWRLGLARAELGGAIAYGLTAGVLVVLVAGAIGAVGFGLGQALGFVGVLLLLLIVLPLLASLYSLIVAMMAVLMLFAGLMAAIFGAALVRGNFGSGAFGAGIVGAIVVAGLALLLLWLAARFSCTTSVMASRADFNLFGALGESWRLTGRAQGRIMLYLALVGTVFGIVLFLFTSVVVAGAMRGIGGGGVQPFAVGAILASIALSVFMAYVSVLVPAGIFRALQPDADASAAVFD